ncbi:MAG TPA: DUF4260 family protein [Gemmatimonadales bacterium]
MPIRMLTRPGLLLRLEGLGLLAISAALFWGIDGNWVAFGLWFLAPDLALLAYFAGPRAGAAAYNLVHTSLGPFLLGVLAIVASLRIAALAALIWTAHIGIDRLLGLGLKYPDGRKQTHLNRL